MVNIDVLAIDQLVRKTFEDEYGKLDEYREKLDFLDTSLKQPDLKRSVRSALVKAHDELQKYIENLEKHSDLNFYLVDIIPLIDRYQTILKTPIKLNFLGRPVEENKEKKELTNRFLEIASKYVDIDVDKDAPPDKITCSNCGKRDFDINNNVYVCRSCFVQKTVIKHGSSYDDINRINISSKYMYDRKIHFRDCIKQYQGKQNSTIKPEVYNDLDTEFIRNNLLIGNPVDTPKEIRYGKITKKLILLLLKELGYTKHYENVHLIHYNITGKPRNDISHLEEKLLDDFDVLTDLYDKMYKNIKRKNFINVQYVFYELLCRHKHPCKKDDFVILKTTDRKCFHDDITKNLFETLNWNHTPLF